MASSASIVTKRNLKLFNGENYSMWKFRLQEIIEQEGASKVLHEDPPIPLTQQWIKWERFARGTLIEYLDDTIISQIPKGPATARQILETFDNLYTCRKVSTQLYLQDRLFNCKLKSGMSLKTHLLEIDDMVRDMIACGGEVNEITKVWYTLNSLPPSYAQIKAAIKTMTDDRLTVAFVKGMLLEHEETLIRENSDTSIKALHFRTTNGNDYRKKTEKSTQRYKPVFKRKQEQKCFHCGRNNHIKRDCYYYKQNLKIKDRYKKRNNHQSSASTAIKDQSFAFMVSSETQQNKDKDSSHFVLDSGATEHIINDYNLFTEYEELMEPIRITVAKIGTVIEATHIGKIKVTTTLGYNGELQDVLYSKSVPTNLISVRRIQEAGMSVLFTETGEVQVIKGDTTIIKGKRMNNLYIINLIIQNAQNTAQTVGHVAEANIIDKIKVWHERLGHISKEKFTKIKVNKLAYDNACLQNIEPIDSLCEACINAKQARLPFGKAKDKNYIQRPLFVVHSDVCGPITPSTVDEKNYFVNFIDDYTHYTVTYLMTNKSEVFSCLNDYVSKAEAHFNTKLVNLYCDNGREYLSGEMKEYCKQKGITYHLTVPYTPQQNGLAERMNRTLTEKARAILHSANLDKRFWGEAILTASYLVNRLPTKAIKVNKTPYEMWHNKKPKLGHLKIFGCTAYVHNKTRKSKFDSKSSKGILVGYVPNGYKIFIAETNKFIVARDVIFDETTYKTSRLELDDMLKTGSEVNTDKSMQIDEDISAGGAAAGNKSVEINTSRQMGEKRCKQSLIEKGVSDNCTKGQTSSVKDVPEPTNANSNGDTNLNSECESPCTSSSKMGKFNVEQDVRKSKRLKDKPVISYKENEFETYNYFIGDQLFKDDIPKCYQDVAKNTFKTKWESAIKDELESLERNKTWTLVQKSNNMNVVDCKWVFTVKEDKNGNLVRYKARLVARGFSQRKTLDYDETFAPVARIGTFRCVLALANQFKLLIHQMDVKTAFLNGTLKENIYMRVPDGVAVKSNNMVCKLHKSLYGLKQSARCWYEHFNTILIERGFKNSSADNCLYLLDNNDIAKNIYVILYVDDLVIATKDITTMNNFKNFLMKQFEMVDLKEIKHFLGIRIERSDSEILLDQTVYLQSVLRRFNMNECNPVSTPLPLKLNYSALNSDDSYDAPCRNLIGCIMYAMLCTRPDLCTAINLLSRYQNKSNKELWLCLKRILRYIKGTINIKLVYKRNENYDEILTGYVDADWANDELDRKSTTGCLFKLFKNCTVTWFTRRQNSVAASSTEAEYMAVFEAVKEALWIKSLLVSINVDMSEPIILYEDNQSCIAMSNNPVNHKRSKHIDIKYHFTREQVENKTVRLKYLSTGHQEADILTKSLPMHQFRELREKMGLQQE